ncbi:hypothetical protein R3P38DRAFT_3102198 [Favolaschia claudopus]|uniref:Uncharacterized protein n=1 Tax=Favolaschia claudopus TaxID=2862362 RepID=A0AAV9ZL23_9AGAR
MMDTSTSESDSDWDASTHEEYESFLDGSRTTMNIFGGSGGRGGRSFVMGGTGGRGDGPKFRMGNVRIEGNVVTHSARKSGPTSNFRRIRLGDVDLQPTTYDYSDCGHDEDQGWQRRIHQARITGKRSEMTVIMYDGKNAKKKWKQDVKTYMGIRHPSVIQLYGMVQWKKMYASVFHDSLIPKADFLRRYQDSPMRYNYASVYLWTEYNKAKDYVNDLCDVGGVFRSPQSFPVFIRSSTGHICIDPGIRRDNVYLEPMPLLPIESHNRCPNGLLELLSPQNPTLLAQALTFEWYHGMLLATNIFDAVHRTVYHSQSNTFVIKFNSMYRIYRNNGPMLEIASLQDVAVEGPYVWTVVRGRFDDYYWHRAGNWDLTERLGGDIDITNTGWTRISFFKMPTITLRFLVKFQSSKLHRRFWLSQVHHIFSSIGGVSDVDNYVMIDFCDFSIRLNPRSPMPSNPFYLFLCPPAHLQISPGVLGWPTCSAYWSLDPLGEQRLSVDETVMLGLPTIEYDAKVEVSSKSEEPYAGLWEFHKWKGFDPDSQAIALHLGYPLYQLCVDTATMQEVVNASREFDKLDRNGFADLFNWDLDDEPDVGPECEVISAVCEEDVNSNADSEEGSHLGKETVARTGAGSVVFKCAIKIQFVLILLLTFLPCTSEAIGL